MARAAASFVSTIEPKPLIGATMFGVTTPCVTTAREWLEAHGYEVLVFHATGAGGQSMEALMKAGFITGSLDITTTELVDELVGGVLSAGPDRLEMAGSLGLPQVVSLGALDMCNFGPKETVPEKFKDRNLYVHNATVTLMRSTEEECAELGRIIARKLNAATGPLTVFIPLGGVSMIDVPGAPFHDAAADAALIRELKAGLRPDVEVVEMATDINDPAFATAMAERLDAHYRAWAAAKAVERRRTRMNGQQALARLRRTLDEGGVIMGAGAGHGPVGEVRGGRRRRPDHHLQLRPLPDGRPRLAGRLHALRRRQRDRHGDGRRGPADRAGRRPVLAGVCGTDPFRLMPVFLEEVKRVGFSGVQNFPTVGLCDGQFRQNLEETGMGYGLEVDMIRAAHEAGLLTTPYVFDPDQARAMAEAGADVVVAHMGLTTKGAIGATTALTLEASAERVQAIRDAAVAVKPGHHRPLPRRPDRRARGRRVRPATTRPAWPGSSAPRAWSDSRPRSRSPRT